MDDATTARSMALPWEAEGLLLDMDGTLADSTPSVVRSWNRLFAELGTDRAFDHALHGQPARSVLAAAAPDLSGPEFETALARIEALEIEDAGAVTLLPGTERFLRELEDAAAELGRPTWTVVTSATADLFAARWAATGLPLPERAVTVDQVSRGKPDPEPFALGAERLGIEPARAVVIEDSPGGLRAGRAAGCRCLALTTTQAAADLAELADALVTSLDDLEVTAHDGALRLSRRI